MSGENKTIDQLYDEILKNRNEIKHFIDAHETRLLLKIEEVRSTVTTLEKENCQLREEVEFLKRSLIRRNIIIHGLDRRREDITPENVSKDIGTLLGVNLSSSDIGDVYPLGKSQSFPIKVEFVSNLKKRSVLRNCSKLKGKKISISQDLTPLQRQESKLLRKHLFLFRQGGKHKDCSIRGNKLIVDGKTYEVKDLEERENQDITIFSKPASAPDTPIDRVFPKIHSDKADTPKIPVKNKPAHPVQISKQVQNIPKDKPRTRSVKQ